MTINRYIKITCKDDKSGLGGYLKLFDLDDGDIFPTVTAHLETFHIVFGKLVKAAESCDLLHILLKPQSVTNVARISKLIIVDSCIEMCRRRSPNPTVIAASLIHSRLHLSLFIITRVISIHTHVSK